MTTITIARRFRGPEDSGNGGYTCGLIAAVVGGDAQVTLRRPPPLDRPLRVLREAPGWTVMLDDETVVAEAERITWEINVPDPPSLSEAVEAASRYAGLERHAFPSCFVCGTDRAEGDGLRIFAGPVAGRKLWAAPWRPTPDLPTVDGELAHEMVWSALDCPGAWAVERASESRPVVLGRMAARVTGRAPANATYVVAAWPMGRDGRKLHSGTAVFDESGRPVGAALQTWIILD